MIRPRAQAAIPEFLDPEFLDPGFLDPDLLLRQAAEFMWADRPAEASDTVAVLTTQARTDGDLDLLAATYSLHGHAALRRGRVVEAIGHLERVVALPRHQRAARMPSPEAGLVDAYVARGELDQAVALTERLEQVAHGDDIEAATATIACAALAGARGDHEPAASLFSRAGHVAQERHHDNPACVPWRSGLALSLARLGRTEEAGRVAAAEVEAAQQAVSTYAEATALRTLAAVSGGQAHEDHLRTALDIVAEIDAPRLSAQVATDLAAALAFPGVNGGGGARSAEAAQLLHAAEPHARAEGLLPLQQRIARLMLLLGERDTPHRVTPQLTKSEHRVASIAATGRTNHEIATELVVTVKAIEWHLSNVYRKLGIRGRRDLPAALADRTRHHGILRSDPEGAET